jgi:hypothetical protein
MEFNIKFILINEHGIELALHNKAELTLYSSFE